jgi:hypothetical protein
MRELGAAAFATIVVFGFAFCATANGLTREGGPVPTLLPYLPIALAVGVVLYKFCKAWAAGDPAKRDKKKED